MDVCCRDKVTEKQNNDGIGGMSIECWSHDTRIIPISKRMNANCLLEVALALRQLNPIHKQRS